MYSKFADLLEQHKTTSYRVAKDLNISPNTLSSWKKGVYTPKMDKIQKIADYFNVPISYFTDETTPGSSVTPQENGEEKKKIPKELKKILEEEEVALNGRMMSDQDKKFILGIIEATYRELQEMDSRSKK